MLMFFFPLAVVGARKTCVEEKIRYHRGRVRKQNHGTAIRYQETVSRDRPEPGSGQVDRQGEEQHHQRAHRSEHEAHHAAQTGNTTTSFQRGECCMTRIKILKSCT